MKLVPLLPFPAFPVCLPSLGILRSIVYPFRRRLKVLLYFVHTAHDIILYYITL
jgi:hypothetical protein